MDTQQTDRFTADIATIQAMEQVPLLLGICARTTGMRFAAIARVTDARWMACASYDRMTFGLEPGDELDVTKTICQTVRHREEIVAISDTQNSDAFRDHPFATRYGLRSCISVPIIHGSGAFFGTLCAFDSKPCEIDARVIGMFELFASLIAAQIESGEALRTSEAALLSERETAKLREEFIAVVGHDLRNPVAAMGAGLRLMDRQMDADDAARALLPEMRRTVLRTHKIIDNLLDFARGRLGEGIVAERADGVDLGPVISDIAGEISAVAGNPIELSLDLDRTVSCDPQRIGQMVSNLLSNAVTHGDTDSPVRVSATIDDRRLRIEVRNSGPPIPPGIRTGLFEPFARGDRASQNGLGLGLYISSEIARAHGGRIDVSSDEVATVFAFTMPLDPTGFGAP